MAAPRRVALLTTMPGPYRVPFFRDLGKRFDLRVFFDTMAEPNRGWTWEKDLGFPYQLLKGFQIAYQRRNLTGVNDDHRFLQVRPTVVPALLGFAPDIVISPEMGLRTIQAAVYCALKRVPLVLWWEGTVHTEGRPGRLKNVVRRWLVKRASRIWTNGKDSAELLLRYGADAHRIDPGMTGIDAVDLRRQVQRALPTREDVRRELKLSGVTFLYLGRLYSGKGIAEYLEALDVVYREGRRGWSLLFVGSGNLEGLVRDWAANHPEVPVAMTGFVQPSALSRYYAAADAYVLPTLDDNWSLAALEALVSGLPQIFSVYNGCTNDLLTTPSVGVKIDPRRRDDFAGAIRGWIERPPARVPDAVIQTFIDYYTSESMAERGFRSLEDAARQSKEIRDADE